MAVEYIPITISPEASMQLPSPSGEPAPSRRIHFPAQEASDQKLLTAARAELQTVQESNMPTEQAQATQTAPKPLLQQQAERLIFQAQLARSTARFFFSRMYPEKSHWQSAREIGGSIVRSGFFWFVPSLPLPFIGGLERSLGAATVYLGINPEAWKSYKQLFFVLAGMSAIAEITLTAKLLEEYFWQESDEGGMQTYDEHVEKMYELQGAWIEARVARKLAAASLRVLQERAKTDPLLAKQTDALLAAVEKIKEENPQAHDSEIFYELQLWQTHMKQQTEIRQSAQANEDNEDLFYELSETFPKIELEQMHTLYMFAKQSIDNEATLFAIIEKFPQATAEQVAYFAQRLEKSKKAQDTFWRLFDNLPQDLEGREREYAAKLHKTLRKIKQSNTSNKAAEAISKNMLRFYAFPMVIFGIVSKFALLYLPTPAAFMAGSLAFTATWRTKTRLQTAYKKARETYLHSEESENKKEEPKAKPPMTQESL